MVGFCSSKKSFNMSYAAYLQFVVWIHDLNTNKHQKTTITLPNADPYHKNRPWQRHQDKKTDLHTCRDTWHGLDCLYVVARPVVNHAHQCSCPQCTCFTNPKNPATNHCQCFPERSECPIIHVSRRTSSFHYGLIQLVDDHLSRVNLRRCDLHMFSIAMHHCSPSLGTIAFPTLCAITPIG